MNRVKLLYWYILDNRIEIEQDSELMNEAEEQMRNYCPP